MLASYIWLIGIEIVIIIVIIIIQVALKHKDKKLVDDILQMIEDNYNTEESTDSKFEQCVKSDCEDVNNSKEEKLKEENKDE